MKTMTKTVVGMLKTRDEAQFAVNDLVTCGFQKDAITIRASNVEHHVWPDEEDTFVEKGERSEQSAYAQREGAGLGSRGNAYETVVHVGPGDIAALTELGMPEADARYYSAGIDRGGFLVTVVVADDRAEEAADIIRRHGTIEDERGDSWRGQGWTGYQEAVPFSGAASVEQPVSQRAFRESEPLSQQNVAQQADDHRFLEQRETMPQESAQQEAQIPPLSRTLSEQLERAELFQEKEELPRELAEQRKREQLFAGETESLSRADAVRPPNIQQHDVQMHDVQQRELAEDKVQERAFQPPETATGTEATGLGDQSRQLMDVSAMDDQEFERHFRATYGARGERFDEPYRSAYHFAEAESSSHPQFVDKEWFEVEEDIHRDWEMSHPGTWTNVEDAIHFGWNRTRRQH